jgi:hypothetical protein
MDFKRSAPHTGKSSLERRLVGIIGLALVFVLILSGCPQPTEIPGFTVQVNETVANTTATLGLTATTAASNNAAVATAAVVNGKISVTSVGTGAAVIMVSDSSTPPHTATIAVTVAADGAIAIGAITKYEGGKGFTATTNADTANDEATLGLTGATAVSNKIDVAGNRGY